MRAFADEKYYSTYFDWSEPENLSAWSEKQKGEFLDRANTAYKELKTQRGTDFEVINDVSHCVK